MRRTLSRTFAPRNMSHTGRHAVPAVSGGSSTAAAALSQPARAALEVDPHLRPRRPRLRGHRASQPARLDPRQTRARGHRTFTAGDCFDNPGGSCTDSYCIMIGPIMWDNPTSLSRSADSTADKHGHGDRHSSLQVIVLIILWAVALTVGSVLRGID